MNENIPEQAVAVIGMSGRFPGAGSVEEFWANLRDGVCSVTDFTEDELRAAGVDDADLRRSSYVRSKGVLTDAGRFEPELFGFGQAEAAAMDPQHRVLLETAWSALEDGGYDPRSGPERTGVYVGGSVSEHMIAAYSDPRLQAELGALQVRMLTGADYLALWISYRLGLEGPSMTVQTACSTSLTAVHVATQALLLGECDAALAGGVAVGSIRPQGYVYYDGGIFSPDGRCRPFDESAAGTLPGNGVGLVLLRRLEDAIEDGDPIRAVIRGSAVTNDGQSKVGFTAPGIERQTAAMVEAWASAGLDPASAQYLEMHGTGTALGDRIEIAAAADAVVTGTHGIGSVKANIGHLDAASGIAGLTKAVLMLQHQQLAPTINVTRPQAALADSPFRLIDRAEPWDVPDGTPRRAGVSALGIGGTNVHVVLEEAPSCEPTTESDESWLLPVSARTPEQAQESARRLARNLRDPAAPSLSAVARTLQRGRSALGARAFVVADSRDHAATALEGISAGGPGDEPAAPPTFLFPGQGVDYPSLGSGLYTAFQSFRTHLDECARILLETQGIDPRSWLGASRDSMAYWTPTIVAIEYSIAKLWEDLGVVPAAMVGHSLGEYAAACVAGVLRLEDALALAALRGALMEQTKPGRMVAAALSEDEARELLCADVELAAVNAESAVVLAGGTSAMDRVSAVLAERRVPHRAMAVTRAFHSALMEPVLPTFAAHVAKVELDGPRLPYVSSVTGDWVTAAQVTDPSYWVDQIRRPVRFHQALLTVGAEQAGSFLELGPGNTLSGLARRTVGDRRSSPTMGSDPAKEAPATWRAIGQLWVAGQDIVWPSGLGRRVHLPTYPFVGRDYGALLPAGVVVPAAVTAVLPAEGEQTEPGATTPVGDVADVLIRSLGLSGPDDLRLSYFEVGGDSLAAVNIVGRLRDELGIELRVEMLLEQVTLEELCGQIERLRDDSAADEVLESLLSEIETGGAAS